VIFGWRRLYRKEKACGWISDIDYMKKRLSSTGREKPQGNTELFGLNEENGKKI
jgi:hypothetical protein